MKQHLQDSIGIPEIFGWRGMLEEVRNRLSKAEVSYREDLVRWTGRRYFECAALTGLVRIKDTQGDYTAIPPLLAEAEQLAQQCEYNDHLASLRLTQG